MTKTKLLVARHLPKTPMQKIYDNFDIVDIAKDSLTDEQVIAAAQGCQGILVGSALRKDLIDKLPDSIKIFSTMSVGFDHIDVAAANARGIIVCNTPSVLDNATAEIALLCMLGAARGANWGHTQVATGQWGKPGSTAPLGIDVTGKKVAILGMGRIGRAFAKLARGLSMEVHYYNRSRLSADLEQGAIYHETLEKLLPHAQFLSIHAGLTPDTKHILDAKAIELMPDGAVLINTSRGDLVVDDAVIGALKSGKFFAAGLDVFSNEPNLNPEYMTLDNVFMLPHVGSATIETRDAMGGRAADNLIEFFNGNDPISVIEL
ncbi:MAG: D-glycerate dehydrogenase [OCS116 cluster bacterium]|nr:D-glycerate dehydrogenase [OCS116 cluster bacterium]